MKIKIILASLIICTSILGMQYTHGFQLQDWMEKVYLNHQSKKMLKEMVKGSDKGWNMHDSSIRLARHNAIVSINSSIELIISEFKTSVWQSCALTYDDAATLLVKDRQFKRFLNWIKDTESDFSYKIDDSNFVPACIRYLNCINKTKKESNILSTSEYEQCTKTISDKFNRYFTSQYGKNQIGSYSYGDEIFVNGTLEDSSFDLMYDIEQINKILYANPKRIPKYYLRGPPDYLSKTNTITQPSWVTAPSYTLVPSKLFAWNTSVPTIQDAIKQIENSQWPDSNIVSNLQCFDPAPIIASDDAKLFKKEVEKIKKAKLTLEEDKILDEVIGVVSQPFWDEAPTPTPGADLPAEILEPVMDDGWDTTPPNGPGSQNPPNNSSSNPNTPPNNTSQNNCPTNVSQVSEQFDLEWDKPQIKQCLQSCNQCVEGIAKKACYSQCLCTSFASDAEFADWLGGTTIGLRLCNVPSTTPDIITPGTQVVSIQEIISSISALMGKLKESWQYIPSGKPTEFFSPTIKVKKLVNAFNFTINTISKSKYRIRDKQVEAEAQVNYFETQVPDISQLHIQAMMKQNEGYNDFILIQKNFREQFNTVLQDRDQAAKQFYQQVSN